MRRIGNFASPWPPIARADGPWYTAGGALRAIVAGAGVLRTRAPGAAKKPPGSVKKPNFFAEGVTQVLLLDEGIAVAGLVLLAAVGYLRVRAELFRLRQEMGPRVVRRSRAA